MDLNSVYCRVQYKGAGSECTTNSPPPGSVFDQPPAKPPFDKTPVYNKDNICGEWTTASDGIATRTCTGTEQYVEPGKLNCENSNGMLNCASGKPAPELSDTKVTETTEMTTKPDGSTDTNTSKTTDKTTCKGTKPCTSTSKTETTTSGTNPDGTPGDEKTECTGDNCKPGDDGEGEDEEGEDPERSADAGDCDGSFSCEGDPINCAILKKQKEQQCFAEEQADFEGHKDDIESLVQGDKFELDEGGDDIDVPGLINKGTRFLPASCPPDETVNLITAGGHTFKFTYEPLCRAATDLGNLFVAFALVFAALYVGRSVGGS
ncbi:virulence factor TspB C-terminal domain-related protein [Pseudomonas sp. RL_15y_Pfl2_60]|uniref:virulence factor TspB C-terminal domain-related protein n=1 Tax=Pseudomonas sp. RL_15y_Pfl2_60 TaxID=3088709 RepID=UPI0030DD8178